ncbi:complement C1q tumor necrosis factor-related protein 6-like [Mercenaria mercenaria]|uniref:complement C1q tumor necrosis factor-related protein 6-like n=1 Tax=Mercenaria mercenaria TaxID=6596 RepID=UPI00234E7F52|nr:complement C1q tumor necrosis factor-related protein 6-like [Mercenaria mercenaria]
MKMLMEIVVSVALCVFVSASEPECSRFHYEEKTLEKIIKTEIYVDKIKSETETMQQRMSDKLDGIQEDWEKTKNELNDAKADSRKAVEEIKESISTIQAVGFLAHDITKTAISDGDTLVFKTTHFDVGSSYNNETGIFVAPVAGIYMFTLQLCIASSRYVHFEIDTKKGPILKGCFIDDGSSYNGCQTATTVAELGIKEPVWIKKASSSSNIVFRGDSDIWNSLSGALISAVTK